MSNSTIAVWPSAEIWSACAGSSGERRFLIVANGCTASTTSSTSRGTPGPSTVSVLLWTSDDLGLRVGLEAGVAQDVVGAVRLADVRVVLVDLSSCRRPCRRRARRPRRRASRRPRSSSDLRSSDPCGPRCCWTSSRVTLPDLSLSPDGGLVCRLRGSHRAEKGRWGGQVSCGVGNRTSPRRLCPSGDLVRRVADRAPSRPSAGGADGSRRGGAVHTAGDHAGRGEHQQAGGDQCDPEGALHRP